MLERGIIKELLLNENKIIVRIPMFETAGGVESLFTCTIANQPGIIGGYKVDDIVMVDFENNDLDSPIIVGSFYTGLTEVPTAGFSGDSLDISGHTSLSADFKVGEISYTDLLALKKQYQLEQETSESSSSGNQLYKHNIHASFSNDASVWFSVISSNNVAVTTDIELISLINDWYSLPCYFKDDTTPVGFAGVINTFGALNTFTINYGSDQVFNYISDVFQMNIEEYTPKAL